MKKGYDCLRRIRYAIDQTHSDKSSLGLQANVVILIIWFGGFVISLIEPIAMFAFAVPFVILFLEKDSNLVRSHAIQAVSLYIINIILSKSSSSVIPVLVFLFFVLAIIGTGVDCRRCLQRLVLS